MQKLWLFILLLSGFTALEAQDFNRYEPLTCSGKIPEEITTESTKKFKSEIKKIESKKIDKKERKDRKQFALESNFVVDNLLQSGLVLFNDPISNYLNEVADVIVAADKGFKKKVRVYTLRSGSVNAFATDRGTVFVTLGLLAQLENEAQLAFVLSHELAHVKEGHALDLFLEAKDIERNASRKYVLNESTFDEALISKNQYSKELETAADKKGLETFLQTGYSTATLNTVFDVLKYAYLPFDDVKFDPGFFESADYKFPDNYQLAEVKPISGGDEKVDDKKSSHPNIGARREATNRSIETAGTRTGKNFLISEERFGQLRQIARFELPMLYLHRSQHPEAIYTSYLLLQKQPSQYLEKCIAKALYMRAKLGNDGGYRSKDKTEDIEGESQQVYKLLNMLGNKEGTILALRYAWKLHFKYPEDKELKAITEDLFIELGRYANSISEFYAVAPAATATTPVVDTAAAAVKERSKYEKINEQKGKVEPGNVHTYWRAAYIEFIKDETFVQAFEKGQKEYEKRKERTEYYETSKGKAEWRKEQKREEKKGQRLGIPKIVIVNPFYLKLDSRKDKAVQYVQTEYGQEHIRGIIEEVVPKSDLKVTILDVADLKDNQTDRFNEIRMLNDWFSEQVDFDELSLTPGTNQAKIDAIAEKYGTDYFLWTGVISLREKNNAALKILAGVILYPILPFAIYSAAKPEYDMLYYAILYDVKTGRRKTVKFEYFDKRDSDMLLKAHFYDAFVQIKTEEKK